MLDADSITDKQIKELRDSKRSRELWNLCDRALRKSGAYDRAARTLCAELFNDRLIARARAMNVDPERLVPHAGTGPCSVCGCEPGEQHHLATHEANADATGG